MLMLMGLGMKRLGLRAVGDDSSTLEPQIITSFGWTMTLIHG